MKTLTLLLIITIFSLNLQGQYKGELLGRARECSEKANFECVIENLNQLIPLEKNKDKLSNYYINLGIAHQNLNDLDKSLNAYNQAIELDKKNPLAYYRRGLLFEEIGNSKEMIKDLETFLSLFNKIKNGKAYQQKLAALGKLGKTDELINERKNASSNEDIIGIEIILTRIKKDKKLYEEAISDYLKLIEKYPNNHILYNNLADTYLLNGQFSEGMIAVDKSIELNSKYFTSFMTKAELLMSLNKVEESCASLNKAIELGFNPTRIPDLLKQCKN